MIRLCASLVRVVILLCWVACMPAEAITVHLIGDSTMAERDHTQGNPEYGWGEMLSQYFLEDVEVLNAAAGGRSAKSFIDQGLWARAQESIQPGDWVILQFGHNDQKKHKPQIYAPANGAYRELLTRYVRAVQAKGARPILVNSIYRRIFKNGVLVSTLGDYPAAVAELAENLGIPFIDLHRATGDAIAAQGVEGSLSLFVHFEPGEHAYFPEGRADNSHLSREGAQLVADLFVVEMCQSELDLAKLLRSRCAN